MNTADVADRLALHELTLRYAAGVDGGDAPAVAELFTEDAVFHAYDRPRGTARGRAEIRALLDKLLGSFTATVHHTSAPLVEFIPPDRATGVVTLNAWHSFAEDRRDGILWGRYLDEYTRTSDRWLIARRRLVVYGQQDFEFPWITPTAGGSTSRIHER